jgi:hypothetical protein
MSLLGFIISGRTAHHIPSVRKACEREQDK